MAKAKTKKRKSLFDHLKAITQQQDPDYFDKISEQDKKSWSNYMLLRFMSMNDELMPLVEEVQYLVQNLEPELFYKTFIGLIPKKSYYAKYIKAKGTASYEDWLVELVAKEYEVSKDHAEEYLQILFNSKPGKKTIRYICEKYATDPKKIKKIRPKV